MAHLLNPFNPFKGQFSIDLLAGFFTTLIGLLQGFVREKTESIIAPSLIHGIYNGFTVFLEGDLSMVFIGIGWSIAFVIFFTWLFRIESKGVTEFRKNLFEEEVLENLNP